MIEEALVKIYGLLSVSEAREKFSDVRSCILHVVLVAGNLVDNHPYIVEILMFRAAIIILPELERLIISELGLPILKPLLRVFGFGSLGPLKGTLAAWLQRFFFKAVVKKGSWFSKLQSAAMKWYI